MCQFLLRFVRRFGSGFICEVESRCLVNLCLLFMFCSPFFIHFLDASFGNPKFSSSPCGGFRYSTKLLLVFSFYNHNNMSNFFFIPVLLISVAQQRHFLPRRIHSIVTVAAAHSHVTFAQRLTSAIRSLYSTAMIILVLTVMKLRALPQQLCISFHNCL